MNVTCAIFAFGLLLPSLSGAAELKAGTLVPVRLTENVNGNINFPGQTVYFQTVEDVYVGEEVVIRRGTFLKGRIKDAVGRRSLGKGGKLTLVPKSHTTENKELIRFVEAELGAEGRARTGATVAHTVAWGPLGLFAKGRAAYIFLDTEYDLEASEDVDLEPVEPFEETDDQASMESHRYRVAFADYRRKINYRKGKIQKDFVLHVEAGEESLESLDQNSIQITRILGYDLPARLEPVSVQYNKGKKRYEVAFAFKEMVKYISPGAAEVTVRIGNSDAEEFMAILTTEWKLE